MATVHGILFCRVVLKSSCFLIAMVQIFQGQSSFSSAFVQLLWEEQFTESIIDFHYNKA